MSRLHQDNLKKSIHELLEAAKADKRKFIETVDFQVRLKGYNIAKDKRFIGSIKLPHVIRPNLRVGILGNKIHCEQAQAASIKSYDMNFLTNLNKEKKPIKYWARKHHLFLASEDIVKNLNKTLGPQFNKTGKFPAPIRNSDAVASVVDETKKTTKFRLKKSIAFGLPVGNVGMTETQLYENIMLCSNYVASLLKKQWQSIGAIVIHATMGKPHRIY